MRTPVIAPVLALLVLATACGGSGSGTSPSPAACTTGSNATTIVIAGGAACPQNVVIARGTQVTFVNQDARPHEVNSDPHPEHTDCPEINQVGHLENGQSRQTGNLIVVRRCGFHDHINPDNSAMRGSITVQ